MSFSLETVLPTEALLKSNSGIGNCNSRAI